MKVNSGTKLNKMKKINYSKEDLERMIFEEKLSYEKIGKRVNVSGTSIKKYAVRIGISLPKRRSINSKETFNKNKIISKNLLSIENISDEVFKELVGKSKSLVDLENLLNCKDTISTRKYLRNRCKALNIDLGINIVDKINDIIPTNLANFSEEFIKKVKDCPGIYLIENNINHHKYIGQSINLRKRLFWHFKEINWKTSVDNYPLYKAFKKYGLSSFSFKILLTFDSINSLTDLDNLKNNLNYFEKKYIKEFNTCGGQGYNQTEGGDRGIIGYKMTESQKLKVIRS